jgi:hypothetical protein
MPEEKITTIKLKNSTRARLADHGKKLESFDQIVVRLLDEVENSKKVVKPSDQTSFADKRAMLENFIKAVEPDDPKSKIENLSAFRNELKHLLAYTDELEKANELKKTVIEIKATPPVKLK